MAKFIKPNKSTVAHADNHRSVNLDLVTDWTWKKITLISQKEEGVTKFKKFFGYEVEFIFVNNKKITHLFADEKSLNEYLKKIEG